MKEFVISEVKAETAILVGLITKEQDETKTNEYLDELEFLADTAGAVTVKRFTQRMAGPSQVTYVGKGKLEEIRQYIIRKEDEEDPVGMVIFDEADTQHRGGTESENTRPHKPHPRHLRYACTDSKCEDTGGAGAVPLYAASSATSVDAP